MSDPRDQIIEELRQQIQAMDLRLSNAESALSKRANAFIAMLDPDDFTLWGEAAADNDGDVTVLPEENVRRRGRFDTAHGFPLIDPGPTACPVFEYDTFESTTPGAARVKRYVRFFNRQHFFRIASYVQDDTNYRWIYQGYEVFRREGDDAFYWEADNPDALTGLKNFYEEMNGASGVMGNGVDTADLSGTSLEIQPAPIGLIVPVWSVPYTSTPAGGGESAVSTEYWFAYTNGVTGGCS